MTYDFIRHFNSITDDYEPVEPSDQEQELMNDVLCGMFVKRKKKENEK